jgi:uncharacterized membrane protein YfcA
METLIISPWVLAAIFFVVAFLYSAVGLGGGSSYTALLAVFGASQLAIPSVSLSLNVIVSSIGGINFVRKGHANFTLIAPFLISSIPFAWLGGQLDLSKLVFLSLLLLSLLVVTVRIYMPGSTALHLSYTKTGALMVSLAAGAALGFVAGALGIGGGIYLIPLILMLGLGTAKQAAAAGVIFVWVNSVVGLLSRYEADRLQLDYVLPLIVAVIGGALIGSSLGAGKFPARRIEQLLGIVLIVACFFLAREIWILL